MPHGTDAQRLRSWFPAAPADQRARLAASRRCRCSGRAPRVHLWHIGCQMNDADREELAAHIADIGCIPETALEDSDIAVLITCTVRANAEQKVFGKFRELIPWKRARPGRAIALTGCMAVEHGEALLDRLPELDYVFDVREPDGFLAKLQALHAPNLDGPVIVPASDRLSAYVAVMGGCNEMCTYCIVPFVRGRELSRPLPEVVEHVERLVAQGVREVTLLGQNVNSYHDQQHHARLPELLAAVDAVPGLWRLRFLTSHPRNAVPELFAAMRDLPTVCEQLHLPVQAGDNDLLRRMRRLYTVDEYRAKIEAAIETVGPRLALSTDIIVGFCGETEAEFAGTESLMRELRFDTVHLAAYSVRPGTAAARERTMCRSTKRRRGSITCSPCSGRSPRHATRSTSAPPWRSSSTASPKMQGRTVAPERTRWRGSRPAAAEPGELHTAEVVAANAFQLHVRPVGAAA